MSRLGWIVLVVSVAATPTGCGYPNFQFVLSGTGGGSGSSTAGTGGSGGGPALTCATVDDQQGCCDAKGVVHFCDPMGSLLSQTCSAGTVCGWNDFKFYYDCVSPPAHADPSGMYPLACPK
jgi:hypothetical protein